MRLNVTTEFGGAAITTHEGAKARYLTPEHALQRSVMTSLLWEDTFYENGEDHARRVQELIPQCSPEFVAGLAATARSQMHLRHMPLFLAREMARLPSHKHMVGKLLPEIIQRPDEITEFLAIYWKDKRQPLSAQVKKGLARAFSNFNEYSLAKYDRNGPVKLRDALFLSHAKPDGEAREALYKRLADRKLATPDTWEVQLSAGANKKETFERLMGEQKLGALAFLRNLRNMKEANVDFEMIEAYSQFTSIDKILPFRFIAAARAVPEWEPMIEAMMMRALNNATRLMGRTVLVIDNSGSMYGTKVSKRSDIDRADAACALAILLREICESVKIIGFGSNAASIPPRHGFALAEAIKRGPGGGTDTYAALTLANQNQYDRLILITDEQSHTEYAPTQSPYKSYCINVGTYQNGVGYGPWVHIDGWSEAIVEYIRAYETDLDAK